ncbi:hypothetical protein F5Y04DRAFT_284923 [Hypomontagnella monticulosa]|nr:hypothetical protein F5Y04DRAFT_284923 [Hypomontagnella monticulosa]
MHRPKHKQKPSSRPWSAPKWHDQYQQYYLERVDRHGVVEYDWIGATLPGATDQSIPRTDHSINALAEGVENLSVDQGVYDSNQSFGYESHQASAVDHASYTHNAQQPQNPNYLEHMQQTPQQNDKGKGKSLEVEQLDGYGNSSHDNNQPQASGGLPMAMNGYAQQPYQQYPSSYMAAQTNSYPNTQTTASSSSINAPGFQANDYESEEPPFDDTEAEYQEAIRISRDAYYGVPKVGESSYSAPVPNSATMSSQWPTSATTVDPNAYELNSPVVNGEDVPTPRGGSPVSGSVMPGALMMSGTTFTSEPNYIQGTPGVEEPLDPRYRVEPSTRFQPGEVFKILWSEPLGQTNVDDPISDITKKKTAAGGRFYVGFRRFIIVTTDESHHSTCVPILTYDRRGCLKKGVRPNKHGIIYTAGSKPRLLRNEPDLGFSPVALHVYADSEKLAKESRVNYSKLVTIEHNVKVFFIGSIDREDFDLVSSAVDICWSKKMRTNTRRPRR